MISIDNAGKSILARNWIGRWAYLICPSCWKNGFIIFYLITISPHNSIYHFQHLTVNDTKRFSLFFVTRSRNVGLSCLSPRRPSIRVHFFIRRVVTGRTRPPDFHNEKDTGKQRQKSVCEDHLVAGGLPVINNSSDFFSFSLSLSLFFFLCVCVFLSGRGPSESGN